MAWKYIRHRQKSSIAWGKKHQKIMTPVPVLSVAEPWTTWLVTSVSAFMRRSCILVTAPKGSVAGINPHDILCFRIQMFKALI